MAIIDFTTPAFGVIDEYFEYVWIRTLEFDTKQGWIEEAVGKAEVPGMEPVLDFRTHATARSVSGYCSFGIAGHNRDALAPAWTNKSGANIVLWGPTYFLNWKETFIAPPRGFNAIRMWGRARSHFYVYAQTYDLDSLLTPGAIIDPSTGRQVYPPAP